MKINYIFLFLVCQKWEVARKLAWYEINFFNLKQYNKISQKFVEEIILLCGRYLKNLTISNVCGSSIVPIIRDNCYNLNNLELELNNSIDVKDFFEAFVNLKSLRSITINKLDIKNFSVHRDHHNLPENIEEIIFLPRRIYYQHQLFLFLQVKFFFVHHKFILKNIDIYLMYLLSFFFSSACL